MLAYLINQPTPPLPRVPRICFDKALVTIYTIFHSDPVNKKVRDIPLVSMSTSESF